MSCIVHRTSHIARTSHIPVGLRPLNPYEVPWGPQRKDAESLNLFGRFAREGSIQVPVSECNQIVRLNANSYRYSSSKTLVKF